MNDVFFSQQSRLWRNKLETGEMKKKIAKGMDFLLYMQLITDMLFLQSHFSLKKGAAALGIGTDSVILIKCDERWAWICNPFWLAICKVHTYICLLVWKQVITIGIENLALSWPLSFTYFFTQALAWSHGMVSLIAMEPSMALDWIKMFIKSIKKFLHQDGAQGHSLTPTTWSLIYGDVIILGTLDGVHLMD